MKDFPFIGSNEYVFDKTTNTIHFCKYLSDKCNIDHLTPNNSYLIPVTTDNPELTVLAKEGSKPIKCPHCFHE